MEKIYESFKVEIVKYKNSVEAIGGLITILLGIGTLLTKVIDSRYNLAIISVGVFFLSNKICNQIISSYRESFGVTTNLYSKRAIIIAKIIKMASYLLWIFPIFLMVSFIIPKRNKCVLASNLGLLITNFTGSAHDNFSYKLFDKVESELQNNDTVNAIKLNEFVDAGVQHYKDSIKEIFSSYCFDHGLLVYGKRDQDSKLFDCNIYIENLTRVRTNTILYKNQNIIYLQSPDLLSFSIDSQANVVAEFIFGLLYYNNNNRSMSNARFKNALRLNSNDGNKRLISYCHMFIGNNYYKERNFSNAIDEYKKGIVCDSVNAYLHFNLANALLVSSNIEEAKYEYDIVKNIDSDLLGNSFFEYREDDVSGDSSFDQQTVSNRNLTRRKNDSAVHLFFPSDSGSDKVNVPKKDSIQMSSFQIISKNKMYGLVSGRGDTIVACEYDSIYRNELVYGNKGYFIARKSFKFGAINERGGIEIPFGHSSAESVKRAIQVLVNYTNALQ